MKDMSLLEQEVKRLSDVELSKLMDTEIAFDQMLTPELAEMMTKQSLAYIETKAREAARKAV